jgi:hypothetical protein
MSRALFDELVYLSSLYICASGIHHLLFSPAQQGSDQQRTYPDTSFPCPLHPSFLAQIGDDSRSIIPLLCVYNFLRVRRFAKFYHPSLAILTAPHATFLPAVLAVPHAALHPGISVPGARLALATPPVAMAIYPHPCRPRRPIRGFVADCAIHFESW